MLLVFLAWVPIPIGSNRPIFWAINAVLVSGMALYYFLGLMRSSAPLRVIMRELWPLPLIYAAIITYLALQLLPLPPEWRPSSVTPGASMLMVLRWLTYGFLFFLVLQATRNPHRFYSFADAALAIGVLHAASALFLLRNGDTLLGYPKLAYLGSATGTFINRNSFATFMALVCCLATAQVIRALLAIPRRKQMLNGDFVWLRLTITAGAFVLSWGALIASQSRMGVAAGTAGVLVTALVAVTKRLRGKAIIVLLSVLAACGSVAALQGGPLVERLFEVEQSWEIRFALYQQVITLIETQPWIGFGGGSFEVVYPSFHSLPVAPDRVWDKAHNTYLALAAELGIPATMVVLALFANVGWRLRARSNTSQWFASALGLGCLTAVAIHALVDFSMEMQAVAVWWTTLSAACLAQCMHQEHRPAADDAVPS
jgi:O-antigen ligase